MYAGHQLGTQCRMNGAVAFNPADVFEPVSTDQHLEMCFPAFPPARMAPVGFTVVNDFKPGRLESGGKFLVDLIANFHFISLNDMFLLGLVS